MTQSYYTSMGPVGHSNEERCTVTVWRGYAQFSITVELAQIADTRFREELLHKIKLSREYRFGRSPPLVNPVHHIYQHCLPLLERLAPHTALQDLSLERFIHSPTYHLRLVAAENQDIRIDGEDVCIYTPAFSMSPVRTVDLPKLCRANPKIWAGKTWIAPTRDAEQSLDSAQGEVVTADNVIMWFKPRLEWRTQEFERELSIMSRINKDGIEPWLRVPRLEGIVVLDNNTGETTMGILMTQITSGKTLKSPEIQSKIECHKRWEDQVTTIVRELHAHDLVWGDVNPSNVMIDQEMNAWVIDFGGMNNSDFVDDDKRETVEGDKQGIKRLFQEWLPSQSRKEPTT